MNQSIEAIVLNKENRAENYLRFTLFSKDLGICYAMIKASKNKNNPLPDFFNEVSMECNLGSYANNFFIKSINFIECINNFHKNYKGLVECTKLAECLIKNANHLEDFSAPYDDFILALKACSPDIDPRIISIKWLYKFLKREGYPIKEDFATKLSTYYQGVFVNIITKSTKTCQVEPSDLDFIYKKLNFWINSESDIIF